MTKTSEYTITNLIGLTGSLYVSKSANKIVVDFTFLLYWIVISIATMLFFGSLTQNANVEFLKEVSSTNKFMLGIKWSFLFMSILYYVIKIIGWISGHTNRYTFKEGRYTKEYKMINVLFIPHKEYDIIYRDYKKKERMSKALDTAKAQSELQKNINNILNK